MALSEQTRAHIQQILDLLGDVYAKEGRSADAEPLALPRVSLSGHAAFAAPDHVAPLRMAYLERLPSAAPLADFPDFHWVMIRVDRARHVQGFGAARNVEGDVLQAVLNGAAKTSATSQRPRARRSR